MTGTLQQDRSDGKLHILVVEDNDLLRALFVQAFPIIHTVHATASLEEGWKIFVEKEPNIVFLDVGLPDGNGHDLARRIKRRNSSTYIIMATASHYREDKEEAAFNHVDGFMIKPFDKKAITDYIDRYLAMHPEVYSKT